MKAVSKRHERPALILATALLAACGASSPSVSGSPLGDGSGAVSGSSVPSPTPGLETAPAFESLAPIYVPAGHPLLAPAVGDLNEDGDADVVTTTYSERKGVLLLLGHGDGTFETAPDTGVARANVVRVADLNADGHQDVIAASQELVVLLGHGDGTFDPPALYDVGTGDALPDPGGELWVAWLDVADLDAGGTEDVMVANYVAQQLALLWGRGDGTFESPTLIGCGSCAAVAAAEVDGDTDIDLVTATFQPSSGRALLTVRRNLGDRQFETVDSIEHPCPVALIAADLDDDGAEDIVAGNDACDTSSVLLGKGDASFDSAQSYPAGNCHSVAVVDLDLDGTLDIITGSYSDAKIWFWRGVGDGTFVETEGIRATPGLGAGIAASDVNNDGYIDIVLAYSAGQHGAISVLLNAGE